MTTTANNNRLGGTAGLHRLDDEVSSTIPVHPKTLQSSLLLSVVIRSYPLSSLQRSRSCHSPLRLNGMNRRERCGWEESGWLASVGQLLESVRELDERRLAPRGAEEGDTDREAVDVAGGDGDVRVTGHRGG